MKNQISNSWCSYAQKAPQKKVNESYPKYKSQISFTFFKAFFVEESASNCPQIPQKPIPCVVRWPSLSPVVLPHRPLLVDHQASVINGDNSPATVFFRVRATYKVSRCHVVVVCFELMRLTFSTVSCVV